MLKKRIEWIDMARGFAIALVVFAHNPIPHKLSSYIYSFHVPLFFLLSGYLLHDGLDIPLKKFIKKKFISLAIPYFFFSLISYAYWLITRDTGLNAGALAIDPTTPLNGTFMAIRNSAFMTHNAALWFICSLFISEITFYAIYKLVKGDRTLLAISLLVSATIGILYNTFITSALPWSLDTVPLVIVFIGMGFFLKEYSSKWTVLKKTWRFKALVLSILVTISLLTWHLNKTPAGTVDMFYALYGNFALYFLSALTGSLVVILVFESFIVRSKIFSYLGRNSLIIYGLHQVVIFGIIGIIFGHTIGRVMPFLANNSFNKLGNGLTYLLLTLMILIPIIWFLNKYVPQFIGRGPKKKI